MSSDAITNNPEPETGLAVAYRHDVYKLRGRVHENAAGEFAGLAVNGTVPHGADGDAAALSRPEGDPTITVENHQRPSRLSLLTGTPTTTLPATLARSDIRELIQPTDPAELHRRWLESDRAAGLNESLFYPYTSLKYHVLLTAALLRVYRDGYGFEDLSLQAGHPATTEIRPHQTILRTPTLQLCVTPTPSGPHAPLGTRPSTNFADVWSRLAGQPLAVDSERRWRILDAQLRRIRSWSTALAYIDEFTARFGGDV